MIRRAIAAVALLSLTAVDGPPRIVPIEGKMQWQQVGADGSITLQDSDRIPYEPNQSCYRWHLRVKQMPGVATIEERLELPGPAGEFGDAGSDLSATKVDPDLRAATTNKVVALSQGVIVNSWCIADGDPQGVYKITVSQDGRVLWRFRFLVGEEGGEASSQPSEEPSGED